MREKGILGPLRAEGNRKVKQILTSRNYVFFSKYFRDETKDIETGGERCTHMVIINACAVLFENSGGKRTRERGRFKWGDNNKMHLK